MTLIAAANPVWEEVKKVLLEATEAEGSLKGVAFYPGSVVPVNFRLPAIIVMERSMSLTDQAFSWGVGQLRLRLDVLSGLADPNKNLENLETLVDSVLGLFWNDRHLNGTARDIDVDSVTIGEFSERPEHISASLVMVFTFDFQRRV